MVDFWQYEDSDARIANDVAAWAHRGYLMAAGVCGGGATGHAIVGNVALVCMLACTALVARFAWRRGHGVIDHLLYVGVDVVKVVLACGVTAALAAWTWRVYVFVHAPPDAYREAVVGRITGWWRMLGL